MFNSPNEGIASFIGPDQPNVIFELLSPLWARSLVWKLGCAAQLHPSQSGWVSTQGLLNLVAEGGVGHFCRTFKW